MNWQDDIKKFNLPHAKIMYMIYYFNKKGYLTDKEKLKLKEYVILESDMIFNLIEDFENIQDDQMREEFLLTEFKTIYQEEEKYLKKKSGFVSQLTTPAFQKPEFPNIYINEITNNILTNENNDPNTIFSKNINFDTQKNNLFINFITSSPSKTITYSNENSPIGKQLINKKKIQQIKLKKVDKSNNGGFIMFYIGGAMISDDIQKCEIGMSPKIVLFDKKKKKKKNYEKTIIGQAITKIEREKKNY